jgi:hypothetical protein
VVDHFGDAAFSWRLCCALRNCGVQSVTLVIDRLEVLLALLKADQVTTVSKESGVRVLRWEETEQRWARDGLSHRLEDGDRANLVIEAFACEPPSCYIEVLAEYQRGAGGREKRKPSLGSMDVQWLTLDYLATESWADEVHARHSPAPRLNSPIAKRRRWFIPGFSKRTGGLLHGSWRHIDKTRRRYWRAHLAGKVIPDDCFFVLGFGYEDAPWQDLEQALEQKLPLGFKSFYIWRPQGLEVSQSEFDEVLQSCDLNFVRGEDSFIRAHWAAAGPWQTPFVWQPYRQVQVAHCEKLLGWMNQIIPTDELKTLREFHWAWNSSSGPQARNISAAWQALARDYSMVKQRLNQRCHQLALERSLESRIMGQD